MAGNRLGYQQAAQALMLPSGRPNFIRIINDGLPVHHMRTAYGDQFCVVVFTMLLQKFCASFNVSKNMTPDQINDYAITLMTEAIELGADTPSMRLEDFAIFFERAKTGKYGRPFDYLDAALIEEWMDAYWKERMAEVRLSQSDYVREQKFDEERPLFDKQGHPIRYIEPARSTEAMEQAFASMGLVKGPSGRWIPRQNLSVEEAKEQDLQEQRELLRRQQESEVIANGIRVIADFIEFNDPLVNSPHNRQFYENNRAAIEAELMTRAATPLEDRIASFAIDLAAGTIKLPGSPGAERFYRAHKPAIDKHISLLNRSRTQTSSQP